MVRGRKEEEREQAVANRQKSKKLLKEIRSQADEIEADKDEMLDCRSGKLAEHFELAHKRLESVGTVEQAHVDAQLFRRLGEYSRKQAAQLSTGLKDYSVKSFVDAIEQVMKKTAETVEQDEEDEGELRVSFRSVGSSLYKLWRAPAAVDFMYGVLRADDDAPQPKAPKARAKRVTKGKVAARPDELERGDVEQTETDRHVAHMRKHLQRVGAVNFWTFVVDPAPDSGFTRTVENVFHSAFLVKDMFARLDLTKQPPMLYFTDPKQRADDVANGHAAESKQFIMDINYGTYMDVIKKYAINEAFLPPLITFANTQD